MAGEREASGSMLDSEGGGGGLLRKIPSLRAQELYN